MTGTSPFPPTYEVFSSASVGRDHSAKFRAIPSRGKTVSAAGVYQGYEGSGNGWTHYIEIVMVPVKDGRYLKNQKVEIERSARDRSVTAQASLLF